LSPVAPAWTADNNDDDSDDYDNVSKTQRPSNGQKPFQLYPTANQIKTHKVPVPLSSLTVTEQNNEALSRVATTTTDDDDVVVRGGALSMPFDELAERLGGKGRAQIVWDCYSIGVDPSNMFGEVIRLGWDDYESIVNRLPSQRRSQRLGSDALEKLEDLYKQSYGSDKVTKVEGGVATLSYISRASDDTTKLLLKLNDGLEVETVIIPWKNKRSTLCISSQVGCRQGMYLITVLV
jgi:hypothetical protein